MKLIDILLKLRGVAQLGSAPLWGSGGRGFKSRRSDHLLFSSGPINDLYSLKELIPTAKKVNEENIIIIASVELGTSTSPNCIDARKFITYTNYFFSSYQI